MPSFLLVIIVTILLKICASRCHGMPDHQEAVKVADSSNRTSLLLKATFAQILEQSAAECSATLVHEALEAETLSQQMITKMNQHKPGLLINLLGQGRIILKAEALKVPYIQLGALYAIDQALASADKSPPMTITYALQILPRQVLLYKWSVLYHMRCPHQHPRAHPIQHLPGESKHETGYSFDLEDAELQTWREALLKVGCHWHGRDIERTARGCHFSCQEQASEMRLHELSIAVFQRLWNCNHPNNTIVADLEGHYGPQTEAAVLSTPLRGFDRIFDC